MLYPLAGLMLLTAGAYADEPKLKNAQKIESKPASCYGTAVEFATSPIEAATLAAKQKKLVFVLHVSGYFEDPTFT
jgi:hypothetical protein